LASAYAPLRPNRVIFDAYFGTEKENENPNDGAVLIRKLAGLVAGIPSDTMRGEALGALMLLSSRLGGAKRRKVTS